MTGPSATAWTCPFCPLACDHFGSAPTAADEAACPRLADGLALWRGAPSSQAFVDGQPATIDEACAAAAQRLGAARQPLLGGLGCDVAGLRALYPLAQALGAVCDGAGGEAPWHGLRALQDRGQFTTTLAEVRQRADVIVFVGGLPRDVAPLFAERLGLHDPQVALRQVVVLGPREGDAAEVARWPSRPGLAVELQPMDGDLFDATSMLMAALAAPGLPAVTPAMAALAQRLRDAQYAVIVGTPALLPAQGSLIVETVHRIVGHLNQKSRAAALWLGGGNGAATAMQAFAWLSGLPLRTRFAPRGLEHEPLLHGTQALLDDEAIDALLWVSQFDGQAAPPPEARALDLPVVVLGHPALAESCRRAGQVFIPVATPGLDGTGHVFRTDGTVMVPLWPLQAAARPTLAEVARRIHAALPARREAA